MNINRDNYETYFLLYIDHELSVAERKAVEDFVAQHADLQEELEQLQDVVLTPEEAPVFMDKPGLMKSSLAQDTIEENMLMLLDGELDTHEAGVMVNMIAADETLKEDWEILQHTKSDPADIIVFEEKHLLYRRERDNVVLGRFLRWAVAAILIGAGFFATVKIINNKKPGDDTRYAVNEKKKGGRVAPEKNNSTQKNNTDPSLPVNTTNTAQINTDEKQPEKDNLTTKEKTTQQQLVQNQQKEINEVIPPENNKDPKEENLLLASNQNVQIEKIGPERTNQEMTISALKTKPDLRDINMLDIQKNGIASNASLTEETNDDRILYMNEEDVSRSKAGGFFRKIKRTIARKANIKTGNGLKIAGFEIALK